MGSHTGFPGPMSEGNAQADALVSIVDTFQNAVASHQFFHQIVMHFTRSSNSHILKPNKLLENVQIAGPWIRHCLLLKLMLQVNVGEDGGEIGGSRVHFPSAPVKHLADLRNRAKSQMVFQHI